MSSIVACEISLTFVYFLVRFVFHNTKICPIYVGSVPTVITSLRVLSFVYFLVLFLFHYHWCNAEVYIVGCLSIDLQYQYTTHSLNAFCLLFG